MSSRVPGGWARWAWLPAWAVLGVAGLSLRPLTPVDETRYLAVAWEMWQRGTFLVPHLNGVPYTQKPPLLFWLIHLGWWVAGVGVLWPRLLLCAIALLDLWLCQRLARLLWPQLPAVQRLTPWILLATPYWALFSTGMIMFDMLLVAGVLTALLGVLQAARGGGVLRGWVLAGLGIAVGSLAKGPVTLVFVLPVIATGPWWAGAVARWYRGSALALLLALALVLAWLVPAGFAGGAGYLDAILWKQSAGRIAHSFAHREPIWWYLAVLPGLLFPWTLSVPTWSAFARWWRDGRGVQSGGQLRGERFCLVWFVAALVVMSLVSGKQAQYLLPGIPALALLTARVTVRGGEEWGRMRRLVPVLAWWLLAAGAMAWSQGWFGAPPSWAAKLPGWMWVGLILVPFAVLLVGARSDESAVVASAATAVAWFAILYAGVMPALAPRFDVRAVGETLAGRACAGRPIGNVGQYQGQYQFSGRLVRSVAAIPPGRIRAWVTKHPGGCLIAYPARERLPPALHLDLLHRQPYRGGVVEVLRVPGR